MENPWQTPDAPLEAEPQDGAPRMPFEEPGRPLLRRIRDSISLILRVPEEAGHRLGASKAVGPAVAFFAWVGLPLQWLTQAITVAGTPQDPAQNEALLRLFHLPVQPAPTPEQLALTRTFAWVGVAMAPVAMAIGLLLMGLLAHAGLWIVQGLSQRRGMEVTFRALLYASAATSWVGFLNAFLVFVPGFRLPHQILSIGLGLGVLTFQGLVLGHAHGERPWKGVLGLFLPLLLLACLCGCGLALAAAMAGALPK